MGREVGLTYDTDVPVSAGDYLQSETGRTWLILAVREVNLRDPSSLRHSHRQRIRAVVVPEDHPEEDDVIHPLYWKSRG